mmetsp:Transcript_7724/g.8813  ORF Transcript_7724/g.8813 Transcript_7724/m.8813 type:complete len:94 (+) Transcript_7724:268-549(+)
MLLYPLPLDGAVTLFCAKAMEDVAEAVGREEEAELRLPPPNFAAIRAFASSRKRVCLKTYCSSLSPVSLSIPLRSSPGAPGASCNALAGDAPP